MVSIPIKLMAFSVLINLAVGLFILIGTGGGSLEGWGSGSMTYRGETNDKLVNDMSNAFSNPPVEDTSNFGEKLLDFFSLGLYSKVKDFLQSTILALPNFFVQAGFINDSLLYILNSFFLLVYTAGMFELFTGKRIWG